MVDATFAVEPFPPSKAPQTFAREADRERLTPTALEAYRALSRHWKLTGEESASLLSVSLSTWNRILAETWKGALSQDQLMRVSALVGVFKGLNLLFANREMQDGWVRLPNEGPLFQGKAPIDAMIEGGIPLLYEVRRYVDALRGGL